MPANYHDCTCESSVHYRALDRDCPRHGDDAERARRANVGASGVEVVDEFGDIVIDAATLPASSLTVWARSSEEAVDQLAAVGVAGVAVDVVDVPSRDGCLLPFRVASSGVERSARMLSAFFDIVDHVVGRNVDAGLDTVHCATLADVLDEFRGYRTTTR
jgi:hypothetical protein